MMDNPATDPAEGWRRCAIGRARSTVKATIASNGRLSPWGRIAQHPPWIYMDVQSFGD